MGVISLLYSLQCVPKNLTLIRFVILHQNWFNCNNGGKKRKFNSEIDGEVTLKSNVRSIVRVESKYALCLPKLRTFAEHFFTEFSFAPPCEYLRVLK